MASTTSGKSSPLPKHIKDLRQARDWPEGLPMPKAGAYQGGARWTYDDEELLRRYYPLYGRRYTARLLGRTVAAVRVRAARLGLAAPSKKWTKKDLALLKRHYGKMSCKDLAAMLGRSIGSIGVKGRVLGVTNSPKPWSRTERARLIRLHGRVVRTEIARQLNRTYGSVTIELRRLGLLGELPPVTEAMVKTIMEKIGTVPVKQIAQEVGLGMKRVRSIARKHGYQSTGYWWKNQWRPEEDAYLREHYSSMQMSDIARHLGRLVGVVEDRRKFLGLQKKDAYHSREVVWSKREEELLRRLHPTMTLKEIAVRLRRSLTSVTYHVHLLGLKRRPQGVRRWTEKDDALLKKLHGTMNYNQIAHRLERSVAAVTSRTQTLGLTKERPMVHRWTAEEDEQLRMLYGTYAGEEIARRLGCKLSAVYERSSRLGLTHKGKPAGKGKKGAER